MQPYTYSTDKAGGRGRETLFRVTFRNQINLIQIADNKANMIISINTLIISVIISITGYSSVSGGIDFNKGAILIPVILIILTCLISVVYAIQAARPHLIKDKHKKGITNPGKSSILFFGNISKMTMDEYLVGMDELLNSRQSIYKNMTIDIYNQGKVLQRKYHLLSIAYLIFMYGFVFSVLLFLVMFMIQSP